MYSPEATVHRAEAVGSVGFQAGEGGSSVLLRSGRLAQLGLGLASLSSLLLGSSDLSVASLLSPASSLGSTLEQGLGVGGSSGSGLGLGVTKAVLLHGTSMDLLGGGGTTGLLGSLSSANLSIALVLEELLGGLGLGGLGG